MVFSIKYYNQIAQEGLDLLDTSKYSLQDSKNPDAIILRSESLHNKQ